MVGEDLLNQLAVKFQYFASMNSLNSLNKLNFTRYVCSIVILSLSLPVARPLPSLLVPFFPFLLLFSMFVAYIFLLVGLWVVHVYVTLVIICYILLSDILFKLPLLLPIIEERENIQNYCKDANKKYKNTKIQKKKTTKYI